MQIRKIRLSILKEVESGNLTFNNDSYELSKGQFVQILKDLQEEGLIKGFHSTKDRPYLNDLRITIKGEDYLKENSKWLKTYKGLKELKNWIPFI